MKIFVFLAMMLICIAAVVFAPLAIIWALNTLFPVLAINYGFFQWLAVVVLNLTWARKYSFTSFNKG